MIKKYFYNDKFYKELIKKKKNPRVIEEYQKILKYRKKDAIDFELDEKMVAEIFELIHKYSILMQTKIMRNNNEKKLENKRGR